MHVRVQNFAKVLRNLAQNTRFCEDVRNVATFGDAAKCLSNLRNFAKPCEMLRNVCVKCCEILRNLRNFDMVFECACERGVSCARRRDVAKPFAVAELLRILLGRNSMKFAKFCEICEILGNLRNLRNVVKFAEFCESLAKSAKLLRSTNTDKSAAETDL